MKPAHPRREAAVAAAIGLAAATALGAINHAAHPGAWGPRLLWAAAGVMAAVAALVLAGRKRKSEAA
ncbi:MAG TPA: hypothetical protein VEJ18_17070 [Planctomycetota bacterium]|nr:hypothetical protein [Planctomycetota bacterium]